MTNTGVHRAQGYIYISAGVHNKNKRHNIREISLIFYVSYFRIMYSALLVSAKINLDTTQNCKNLIDRQAIDWIHNTYIIL